MMMMAAAPPQQPAQQDGGAAVLAALLQQSLCAVAANPLHQHHPPFTAMMASQQQQQQQQGTNALQPQQSNVMATHPPQPPPPPAFLPAPSPLSSAPPAPMMMTMPQLQQQMPAIISEQQLGTIVAALQQTIAASQGGGVPAVVAAPAAAFTHPATAIVPPAIDPSHPSYQALQNIVHILQQALVAVPQQGLVQPCTTAGLAVPTTISPPMGGEPQQQSPTSSVPITPLHHPVHAVAAAATTTNNNISGNFFNVQTQLMPQAMPQMQQPQYSGVNTNNAASAALATMPTITSCPKLCQFAPTTTTQSSGDNDRGPSPVDGEFTQSARCWRAQHRVATAATTTTIPPTRG
jgi:hypothetical protein